jgi:hypothetical protein
MRARGPEQNVSPFSEITSDFRICTNFAQSLSVPAISDRSRNQRHFRKSPLGSAIGAAANNHDCFQQSPRFTIPDSRRDARS